MKKLLTTLLILAACGRNDPSAEITDLNNKIKDLTTLTNSLVGLIESDYSTCPPSGDTTDALIRKICNVAQAATNEARVEMKGELAIFSEQLQDQINAVNTDLLSHQSSIDALNTSVNGILTSIATLQTQMTSANAAIAALQALTASITGVLAGNLITIDIGADNVTAGPVYETLLRRNDKQRFNGFMQVYGTAVILGNNPLTAVSGQSTVTVSLTAHGYLPGDVVNLTLLVGSRGFTSAQLYGDFVVQTAVANSFTIVVNGTASSNGALGGSAGIVQKVIGRGMGTLWNAGQVSDAAVRVTNLGTKRYNYVIRRLASDVTNNTAEVCWSKTNNLASFATINAAPENGNASITCR